MPTTDATPITDEERAAIEAEERGQ